MMYYNDFSKCSIDKMNCSHCKSEISGQEQCCPNCGTVPTEKRAAEVARDSTSLYPGTVLNNKYNIEKIVGGEGIKKYFATSVDTANSFLIEEKISREKSSRKSLASGFLLSRSHINKLMPFIFKKAEAVYPEAVDGTACPFKEQFELLNSINSPEIQKVYDYFMVKGREYIVLERPKGIGLFETVAVNWPNEDHAVDIAINLCNCVGRVHQAGYVHLNIEPGSIYVEDNCVRLFNFELVLRVGSGRSSYLTLEGYSAPELLAKVSNIDCRADIYSIGAILYWMISKRTIALTATYLDILQHIASPELVRIISSCTTANPDLRCSNLSELRDKLSNYRVSRRRKLHFTATALTDKGMVRSNNEDSCLTIDIERHTGEGLRSYGIYVVADGMGGQQAGEIASSTAVKAIQATMLEGLNSTERPSDADLINQAIGKANLEIYHMAQSNMQYNSMGTTITLGLRVDDELYTGHVGDSRAYLIRQGTIRQLTHDHSVVAGLLKAAMITKAEAQDHPDRGKIYRSLGSSPNVVIDTYRQIGEDDKLKLENGDFILFCTDGLTEHITDEEILQEVEIGGNGVDICRKLILLANQHGGSDNISIVLLKSGIN
jgi:protein phosphatase